MARSFNGSSDIIHADAAHLFTGAQNASFACWVKSAAKTFATIYSEGRTGSAGNLVYFGSDGTTGTKIEFESRTLASGSVDVFDGSIVIFDSTWHHVCMTQIGSTNHLDFYVDGVLDGTFNRTSLSAVAAPTNATFGASDRASVGAFFGGLLAHAASWTRQLKASEVKSLASGVLPSHFAPDHYWPMWGASSPEPDLGTATHVSGTLTGTSQGAGGPPTQIYIVGSGWSGIHKPSTATVAGAAALTGSGSLAAAGTHTAFAAASLTGAGSATVSGIRTRYGDAAITGTGALTAAGLQTSTGAASLTGAGSLTATGGDVLLGAGALIGLGSLTATGTLVFFGISSLAGTGSLSAAGTATAAPHVLEGDILDGFITRPRSGALTETRPGRITTTTRGSIG